MKTTDSIQKTFYEATIGEDNVVVLERKSVEPFSAINLNYQPIPMSEKAVLDYLELFIAVKEEK